MGKVKRSIQLYLLRRAMKKLEYKKRVVSYDNAKRVGLFFDAGADGRPAFINKIINNLEHDGKSVFVLGFFNQKKIPEGLKNNEKAGFVSKNCFSVWMRPKSDVVRNFVDQPYDLLIDLTVQGHFMVKYVAGITKASYKAGVHHSDYLCVYDLLLHLDEQTTDEKLADHAIHYLKILKTPEEK